MFVLPHLSISELGFITLSCSSCLYMVWLLPQIIYNAQRRSISGISFGWHALLLLGSCFDLLYGLGMHMPWLYVLVTLASLTALCIQHLQWWYYKVRSDLCSLFGLWQFWLLTISVISIITVSLLAKLDWLECPVSLYDLAGLMANISFVLYVLPQISKQYIDKQAEGISVWFVGLTMLLNTFDIFSAYALHWAWPSLVGPPFAFCCNLVLLYQLRLYVKPLFMSSADRAIGV